MFIDRLLQFITDLLSTSLFPLLFLFSFHKPNGSGHDQRMPHDMLT